MRNPVQNQIRFCQKWHHHISECHLQTTRNACISQILWRFFADYKRQDFVISLLAVFRKHRNACDVQICILLLQITRDKNVIKPAKGKRQCNCKNKVVTRQIGPGMFQQYTTQECEECGNLQYMRQSDTITVTLEPGTPDGHVRPTLSRFQILLYLYIYSSTWFLSVPVNSWSNHDSDRTAHTGYITQG